MGARDSADILSYMGCDPGSSEASVTHISPSPRILRPAAAASSEVPNINIALPPPPPSHPPQVPCSDLSTPTSYDCVLLQETAMSAQDNESWISDFGKATTELLSSSLNGDHSASSSPAEKATSVITDNLIMLLHKHKADSNSVSDQFGYIPSNVPTPRSPDTIRITTPYSGIDDRHELSPVPVKADRDVIKSAAWLDQLINGNSGVFDSAAAASVTYSSRLNAEDFLGSSEFPGDACSEQLPSPLHRFHSWQQNSPVLLPQSPKLEICPNTFSTFLPAATSPVDEGLRDILGLLVPRSFRERAASLPQAEVPPSLSPSPQQSWHAHALQVPSDNRHLQSAGSPLDSTAGSSSRRFGQATSMEVARSQVTEVGCRASALNSSETLKTQPPSSPTPPMPKSRRAPAKGWWKTEVCKFWKEGTGCRNGVNCRWAHGDQELRRMDLSNGVEAEVSPRDNQFSTPIADMTLSPSLLSHGGRSSERGLLDPLPRPIISPSMTIRTVDEPNGFMPHTSLDTIGCSKWVMIPLQYFLKSQRGKALEETWQMIRLRHLPCLSLAENLLIASAPGVHADAGYWDDLLNVLSGIDPVDVALGDGGPKSASGLRKCTLCGAIDVTIKDLVLPSCAAVLAALQMEGRPYGALRTCDRCQQIAESKANCVGLFNPEINSYELELRPLGWGYKLAQFMRACEEGSWHLRNEHGNILRRGHVVDVWLQHQRYVARLAYVFFLCLHAVEDTLKFQTQISRTPEGLSLAEWMAVAHQPYLYLIFLLAAFPVNRTSVPPGVASVSLDSWRPVLGEAVRSPLPISRPKFLAPPSRTHSSSPDGIVKAGVLFATATGMMSVSKRSAFSSTSPSGGSVTPVDIDAGTEEALNSGSGATAEILDHESCFHLLKSTTESLSR